MSVQSKSESPTKAALSVSQMCRLLRMSRSQFHWHVKKGTFHAPLKLPSNGRPYFTSLMAEENVRARDTSIGVGGEYVIFYERTGVTTTRPAAKKAPPAASHEKLIEGLRSLGMDGVTSDQINTALNASYPSGIGSEPESNILRTVFRFLKRAGNG